MTRVWLVLICLALLGLALVGMRLGWRNRGRRQADLPVLPNVPDQLGEPALPPLDGVYVGTAFVSSWQDRVVHGGLGARANATVSAHPEGVLIDREGAGPVFLPAASITGSRLAPGLAGKVVGPGGLLVISWRLGEAELDTGFRADDKTVYPDWVRALSPSSDGSTRSETGYSPSLILGTRHSMVDRSGRSEYASRHCPSLRSTCRPRSTRPSRSATRREAMLCSATQATNAASGSTAAAAC